MFLFHWKEESQHIILDEPELVKVDAKLTYAVPDQPEVPLLLAA